MKSKFNPFKARMRATFAAGGVEEPRLGAVDRDAHVLHDVQITLEGEARGHGVWLNRQFCEDVARAGNDMGDAGVKVRFGHPAMCSDALGTYLGRAKNFRCVDVTRKESGEKACGVIADIELDEHADRTEWVMNMAESAPDTFGQSIVFTYGDWLVLGKDGVYHSYKDEVKNEDKSKRKSEDAYWAQSVDGRMYAVLGKLHGTDFTDTPAATDGVFSGESLAAEAESMLEEHPEVMAAVEENPDKVFEFLSRMGIMDKLESKRVSGLQAEKDREIAQLKKIVAERDDLLKSMKESTEVEIVRLKAENAKLAELDETAVKAAGEKFESQLKERDGELAKARAEVEQLRSQLDATKAELDGTVKQLTKATKTLSMLGHSVNTCPREENTRSTRDQLAQLPMSEREAFYNAHKGELNK